MTLVALPVLPLAVHDAAGNYDHAQSKGAKIDVVTFVIVRTETVLAVEISRSRLNQTYASPGRYEYVAMKAAQFAAAIRNPIEVART